MTKTKDAGIPTTAAAGKGLHVASQGIHAHDQDPADIAAAIKDHEDKHHATEPPPVEPPPDAKPTITGIAVSAVGQTDSRVSWSVSEPATGQVEYGTSTSYGKLSALEPNLLASHSQVLSGLTADTTYHFRVHSKDSAGQEVTSADASFKTAAVPVQPPTTGKVVRFAAGGKDAAFVTLCKDLTIDVIEMEGGTYSGWGLNSFLDVDRTSAHPLLVRPAPGAAIVWDAAGNINTPIFRIGWSTKASYVTFDPAGTGGSFTAQNYKLGKAGLVMGRYFDHITFNGLIVRNVEGGFGDGIPGQQQHTHAIYIMGNPARSKAWVSNGWDVVGPANRMLNGLQTDGSPSADGVTAKGWRVRSLHRAAYLWSDPSGVEIDGWDIADCNSTIDNYPNTARGVVKNSKAVNAGPLTPGQGQWKAGPLTSGGGNTSS